jgi:hypothetical protein
LNTGFSNSVAFCSPVTVNLVLSLDGFYPSALANATSYLWCLSPSASRLRAKSQQNSYNRDGTASFLEAGHERLFPSISHYITKQQ